MADYTKTTNFTAKDSLASGNSGKIIKGVDFDAEFNALAVAIATKVDDGGSASDLTLSGTNTLSGTLVVTAAVTLSGAVTGTGTISGGTFDGVA